MRKYGNIAIGLLLLTLTACTSEDMERQTVADGTVHFAPQMMSDWNAPWTTRAEAENSTTVQALQGTDGLYLHTSVQRGIQRNENITRGTKYIGIDDGNSGKTFSTTETFHVSGYRYAGNSNVSSVTGANFFNNDIVRSDHGVWKVNDQTYVMPAATDKIDFFAWFVADEETAGVSAINAAGGLQLSYTVPTNIDNQPDLLTAATRGETFSADPEYVVPLSFAHQLTAVNFVLDENVAPGEITEIAFMNVYTGGTLSIGEGISGTWNLTSAPTETTYAMNFETVDAGVLRTGETLIANLMMIPQTFSENQKIRIYMTIDGVDKTLFADLKETRWEPGTTVTYKISTSSVNTLRVSGVTYPTTWSAATGVKSKYAVGDEIGVFGVDATGHVLFANKKYTLNVNVNNDSSWVADDGTKSLYVPGNTYYAYYPYQATLSGAPAESNTYTVLVNNALPTAAQFFSNVITNWTPAEDQSDETKLNAQDLQIGKSTTGVVSTVSFAMEHTMGLASVTMASVQVPNVCYFNTDETVNGRTTEKTTVTTSNNFTGANQPCAISGKHYFVVKPSTDVTFSASSTSILDEWTNDITANVAAAGGYEDYIPENPVITHNYIYRGWVYTYTGDAQTFTVPTDGDYTFECWGAQGGDATRVYNFGPDTKGGKGGYTRGTITLSKDASLYVYVGQEGGLDNTSSTLTYNGGGGGTTFESLSSCATRGGGATDIRLAQSSETDGWSGASLDTRIMIAGGGGGSSYWSTLTSEASITGNATGGGGGGINGCNGHISYRYTNNGNTVYTASEVTSKGGPAGGGTQTSGGAKATWDGAVMTTEGVAGLYGQGATGVNGYGAGGGGGYYGGSSGAAINALLTSAGGGSAFVSGATGCTAISTYRNPDNVTQIRYNNVNYAFTSIVIINGESSTVPQTASFSLDDTETGHSGNGYARITSQVVE